MPSQESMLPFVPEEIKYPNSINTLLQRYPASVVKVRQPLNKVDFQDQKKKQLEYPIDGAALGIIIIPDGRIILARRTRPHAGWALPGGRVEVGEMFDEALAREVREECGVEVSIDRLLLIEDKEFISPENNTLQFWLAVFSASSISVYLPYQTEEATKEGLDIGLFDLDRLPEDMILQDKQKIKTYLQR
ncbi:NUDIX hydrolase [Candidatus Daviesbacteria bacterium]|nr:NUDIX hydrolase [Candidatus Daviesbacteria bacterium]